MQSITAITNLKQMQNNTSDELNEDIIHDIQVPNYAVQVRWSIHFFWLTSIVKFHGLNFEMEVEKELISI